MSQKYTELTLRIAAFGKVINKILRTSYFIPNKYDKIKLLSYVNYDQIIQLAIYLDELYELFVDESELIADLTEEEYNEYIKENYFEFQGEYFYKIRYQYIKLLLKKEFIVLELFEDRDFNGNIFSRVELKIENLSLKKHK